MIVIDCIYYNIFQLKFTQFLLKQTLVELNSLILLNHIFTPIWAFSGTCTTWTPCWSKTDRHALASFSE